MYKHQAIAFASILDAGYDLLAPCGRVVLFGAGSLTPRVGADASVLTLSSLSSLLSLISLKNAAGVVGTVVGFLRRPKVRLQGLPTRNGACQMSFVHLVQHLSRGQAYIRLAPLRFYWAMTATGCDAPSLKVFFLLLSTCLLPCSLVVCAACVQCRLRCTAVHLRTYSAGKLVHCMHKPVRSTLNEVC